MDTCSFLSFVLHFFFCKQKTAYEMRISDWSSDVCSSDLIATLLALGARALHELAAPWPQHRCLFDLGGAEDEVEEDGLVIVGYPHHDDPLSLLAQALGHRQREIGRTSCRERVGQYV